MVKLEPDPFLNALVKAFEVHKGRDKGSLSITLKRSMFYNVSVLNCAATSCLMPPAVQATKSRGDTKRTRGGQRQVVKWLHGFCNTVLYTSVS